MEHLGQVGDSYGAGEGAKCAPSIAPLPALLLWAAILPPKGSRQCCPRTEVRYRDLVPWSWMSLEAVTKLSGDGKVYFILQGTDHR